MTTKAPHVNPKGLTANMPTMSPKEVVRLVMSQELPQVLRRLYKPPIARIGVVCGWEVNIGWYTPKLSHSGDLS